MKQYIFRNLIPPLAEGEVLEERENIVYEYGAVPEDKIQEEQSVNFEDLESPSDREEIERFRRSR